MGNDETAKILSHVHVLAICHRVIMYSSRDCGGQMSTLSEVQRNTELPVVTYVLTVGEC